MIVDAKKLSGPNLTQCIDAHDRLDGGMLPGHAQVSRCSSTHGRRAP